MTNIAQDYRACQASALTAGVRLFCRDSLKTSWLRFSSHTENLCRFFGAPARRVFPDHLITEKEHTCPGVASPALQSRDWSQEKMRDDSTGLARPSATESDGGV